LKDDALGRVLTATYDNGTVIFYNYDAAGNRTTQGVTCGMAAASRLLPFAHLGRRRWQWCTWISGLT